jgi:benzoylformate decarboxylase
MHTSLASVDIGRNYPVDSAAFANIDTTAKAVLKILKTQKLNSSAIRERKRWLAEYDSKRRKSLANKAKVEWDSNPISTSRLMIELDRIIDKEADVVSEIVTSDDHIRKYLSFNHKQPIDKRRRNFDTTSGILGWGLAAAIGTKIGNPKKEVWCLSGDGCFNFGSQALWSAARYEVPIGVVIFNNGQYQANRLTQIRAGGKRIQKSGKFIGVSLGHPDIDYVSMSASYGIEAERVSEPKQLADALKRCRRAMHDGRPYVVDVIIAKRFEGKDSEYYDFFSVAGMQNGR